MRMPCAAATPDPTMTAVGVARPRAQGQAMTRVEIPKSSANRKALLPAGYHSVGIACLLPVCNAALYLNNAAQHVDTESARLQ